MSKTINTLQNITMNKIIKKERSLSINELRKIYNNKLNNSNNFNFNNKLNLRNSASSNKVRENRNITNFNIETSDSSSGLSGQSGSLGMQGKIQGTGKTGICCCINEDSDNGDDFKLHNCSSSIDQQVKEISSLQENVKEVEEQIRRLKKSKEGKLSKIDDLRVLIERIASEQSFILQNNSVNCLLFKKPQNSNVSIKHSSSFSSNDSNKGLHHNNMSKECKMSKSNSTDINDGNSSSTDTTEEGEGAVEGAEHPHRYCCCCCYCCRNQNGQNYENSYHNEVPVEFFNVSNQLCRYWQENVIRSKIN